MSVVVAVTAKHRRCNNIVVGEFVQPRTAHVIVDNEEQQLLPGLLRSSVVRRHHHQSLFSSLVVRASAAVVDVAAALLRAARQPRVGCRVLHHVVRPTRARAPEQTQVRRHHADAGERRDAAPRRTRRRSASGLR